jgi:predicted DNA binding protein
LSVLTEKQRKVLVTSYRRGYYDRPRRANSEDIARELGVSSATLVTHRLKAERRRIRAVLEQAGHPPRTMFAPVLSGGGGP